ncbi:NAD-dependent epimerase/dehydratase family protein [Streptomyces sp. NPDC090025]|uniref:NAD-dependent epimerase/dehydratase family protein n=1 Tax=Streptomyces sp. NPDC090025 TaxID=3365922 RepID=UPI00383513F8
MRVLVIGGSGYVVGLMLPALMARHDVTVLDPRPGSGAHSHLVGSASDPVALAAAVDGVDVVLHAALSDPTGDPLDAAARAFDSHVTSLHLTLAAAHRAGVRHAVHLSSLSVYGDLTGRALDETVPPDATDLYGLTKRLAEQVCHAATAQWDMSVTVLRLAWPTTEEAWPAWSLPGVPPKTHALDGTPVHGLAAGDLGRAVLAALDHRDGFDVFHITGTDRGGLWNQAKARERLRWAPRRR